MPDTMALPTIVTTLIYSSSTGQFGAFFTTMVTLVTGTDTMALPAVTTLFYATAGQSDLIIPTTVTLVTGTAAVISTTSATGRVVTGPGSQSASTGPGPKTTTSPTESSASNNGKLGGGPVAGIAIACLLIGFAIGCILVYLITSRKRRYEGRHFNDGTDGLRGSARAAENSLASAPIGIPQYSSAFIENNLPEPVENNAIKTELSKLKDRVNDQFNAITTSRKREKQ